MKPSTEKLNRLDRQDRLELIMADQEQLGMNDAKTEPQDESDRISPKQRRQARELLHYLTDDEALRKSFSTRSRT